MKTLAMIAAAGSLAAIAAPAAAADHSLMLAPGSVADIAAPYGAGFDAYSIVRYDDWDDWDDDDRRYRRGRNPR